MSLLLPDPTIYLSEIPSIRNFDPGHHLPDLLLLSRITHVMLR